MRAAPSGARPPLRPHVQRRFVEDEDGGATPSGAGGEARPALATLRDGLGTGLEWGLECLADPSDLVFDWIAGTCAAQQQRGNGARPAALLARIVRDGDDAPRADGAAGGTAASEGPRLRERPGARAAGACSAA